MKNSKRLYVIVAFFLCFFSNISFFTYYNFSRADSQPDIIVYDLWVSPSNPTTGDSVTLLVEVYNQGSGAAGTFTVSIDLDYSTKAIESVYGLAPYQSKIVSTTVGQLSGGPHQLGAFADACYCVSESNEANNEDEESFQVSLPDLPDLILSDVWTTPSSPSSSDSVELFVEVYNQGTQSAGIFEVSIILDGDTKDTPTVEELSVGHYATVSYVVGQLSQASHTLKGQADSSAAITEQNENNNVKEESFDVSAPAKPDLIVSNVWTMPTSPTPSDSITLYAQVQNQGEGSASSFKVSVSLNDVVKSTPTVNSLASGDYTIASVSIGSLGLGSYKLTATADSSSMVVETNEDNNEREETFQVTSQISDVDEDDGQGTIYSGLLVKCEGTILLLDNEAGHSMHASKWYEIGNTSIATYEFKYYGSSTWQISPIIIDNPSLLQVLDLDIYNEDLIVIFGKNIEDLSNNNNEFIADIRDPIGDFESMSEDIKNNEFTSNLFGICEAARGKSGFIVEFAEIATHWLPDDEKNAKYPELQNGVIMGAIGGVLNLGSEIENWIEYDELIIYQQIDHSVPYSEPEDLLYYIPVNVFHNTQIYEKNVRIFCGLSGVLILNDETIISFSISDFDDFSKIQNENISLIRFEESAGSRYNIEFDSINDYFVFILEDLQGDLDMRVILNDSASVGVRGDTQYRSNYAITYGDTGWYELILVDLGAISRSDSVRVQIYGGEAEHAIVSYSLYVIKVNSLKEIEFKWTISGSILIGNDAMIFLIGYVVLDPYISLIVLIGIVAVVIFIVLVRKSDDKLFMRYFK